MGWDINSGKTGDGQEEKLAVLGTIDQYELLKELGTGGFGSVYLARDTAERRFVAVKGLPREMRDSAEELERIRRNFELIVQLKHDNIVALRHLHQANKVAFNDFEAAKKLNVERGQTLLVMDYAEGVPLSRWAMQFPDGKVPIDKAIEVARQIASALDYAHQHKIIHRDIKPQNVVMQSREDGSFLVQVLDFGLAAEVRSSLNRSRTVSSVTDKSGTRLYMAPEQWQGKDQKSSADQYSLAVLFYELVVGKVPFQSAFDCGDPLVAMTAVTTQKVEIPVEIPKVVRKALACALAKNGAERFVTCGDFVAALAGRRVQRTTSENNCSWMRLVTGVICFVVLAGGLWWYERRKSEVRVLMSEEDFSVPVESPLQMPVETSVSELRSETVQIVEDAEAVRRRQEAAAELAVFELSSKAESAHNLIEKEPEEVRVFFEAEIRAFENDCRAGNDAKKLSKNIAATNFFTAALTKATVLKGLVKGRNMYIAAAVKVRDANSKADMVGAKVSWPNRYEDAKEAMASAESKALARDFDAATSFAERSANLFVGLYADAVCGSLKEAKQHKDVGRWNECLEIADKVLEWDHKNSEATKLKKECERNLMPSLRFVAKIHEREVNATAWFGGKKYVSPWVWENIKSGLRVPDSDVEVEYSEGDKNYTGKICSRLVDWKGLRVVEVQLEELNNTKSTVHQVPASHVDVLTVKKEQENEKGDTSKAKRSGSSGNSIGQTKVIQLLDGEKLEFVYCPPGTFMMGSPESEEGRSSDEKQHRVTLTKGFWMGKFPVTQRQWFCVMGNNPSGFRGKWNCPVENVSWDDVQEFLQKINTISGCNIGLPTEAQWEYACRAGTTGPFAGNLAEMGWNGVSSTMPVGQKKPNAWGIYDMHGNVCEWCFDVKDDYNDDAVDPIGNSGWFRVIRGGSWAGYNKWCRSAYRSSKRAGGCQNNIGFRVCMVEN